MATGKRSFLLYADLNWTVKHLTDEQAGQLFKHLLAYVNDENPETSDPLIKIAFEPIKQSLKRDLKKYETIQKKRSEAGLASAKSRRKKKQKQQVLTGDDFEEHTSTNSTVNVSDSVSVNVSDSVINKKSTDVDKKTAFADFTPDSLFPVKDLAEVYCKDEKLLNAVSETTGRTVEQLKNYLPDFVRHLETEGRSIEKPGEFAKYFRNKVKFDGTFQKKTKPVPASEEYQWIFKGTTVQKGNREQYEAEKKNFDQPGFGFKTIKTPLYGN